MRVRGKVFNKSLYKNIFRIMLVGALLFTSVSNNIFATDETDSEHVADDASSDRIQMSIYDDLDTLEDNVTEMEPINDVDEMPMMRSFAFSSPTKGFVQFNQSDSQTVEVYPTSTSTRRITTVSASVMFSGVVPFYDEANGRYKIMISGVEGWISKTPVVAYDASAVKGANNYNVENGKLYHNISRGAMSTSYSWILNGPAPSFLSEGNSYYSSDGHYFYRDITTMINDYAAGVRTGAINKTPFYNYYQFLSYRTETKITADQMESYIRNVKGYTSTATNPDYPASNESMFVGNSQYFMNYGKRFGTNPITSIGIAINESAWGRSYLAIKRKNLFGHSAYDSYPGAANEYPSIADSIHSHSTHFLNWGFIAYDDWRYEGGYLGDKSSGINVAYASDPYWGEKAAQHYYYLDAHFGNPDLNQYSIGIVVGTDSLNVRKDPTSSSTYIHSLDAPNQAVLILGEVEGQSINGSTKWYRIASDPMLDSNRNRLEWITGGALREAEYDFNNSYSYVHSSYIQLVAGKNPPPIELNPDPQPQGKKGDVNGDGKITLIDLALVKSHLLGNAILTGDSAWRADVNNDGKITLIDMALIKSHLLGNSSLD